MVVANTRVMRGSPNRGSDHDSPLCLSDWIHEKNWELEVLVDMKGPDGGLRGSDKSMPSKILFECRMSPRILAAISHFFEEAVHGTH